MKFIIIYLIDMNFLNMNVLEKQIGKELNQTHTNHLPLQKYLNNFRLHWEQFKNDEKMWLNISHLYLVFNKLKLKLMTNCFTSIYKESEWAVCWLDLIEAKIRE